VTALVPSDQSDFGDSPNIAVGPDGTVYVSWDFGPSNAAVVTRCNPVGSCSYTKGDLNVVIQTSTDGGKTFGPIIPVSPGYPWSGADNGPMVVDPSGQLDMVFQDYPTNPKTHILSPAINFFTSSDDDGTTWSPPVIIGLAGGSMSTLEWWNEPSIGIDAGDNLYAAWDTQGKTVTGTHTDTGWLSYSQNGGTSWSTPVQAPMDTKNVPHIMQVTGGATGTAYVAWLSDSNSQGYALYLRVFSMANGWLTLPVRISKVYGDRDVWPGDTFGLSTVNSTHIMTSWGGAAPTGNGLSSISAAPVTVAS